MRIVQFVRNRISKNAQSPSTHSQFSPENPCTVYVFRPYVWTEQKKSLTKKLCSSILGIFSWPKSSRFFHLGISKKGIFFVLLLLKCFWRNFNARQSCAVNPAIWVENVWLSKFNFGNVWLCGESLNGWDYQNYESLGILLALAVKTI